MSGTQLGLGCGLQKLVWYPRPVLNQRVFVDKVARICRIEWNRGRKRHVMRPTPDTLSPNSELFMRTFEANVDTVIHPLIHPSDKSRGDITHTSGKPRGNTSASSSDTKSEDMTSDDTSPCLDAHMGTQGTDGTHSGNDTHRHRTEHASEAEISQLKEPQPYL